MSTLMTLKDIFLVGSILGLVIIGGWITLRSGVVASGRERGAQVLGNLSRMIVGLLSGAALLSLAQQWAGMRLAFLP